MIRCEMLSGTPAGALPGRAPEGSAVTPGFTVRRYAAVVKMFEGAFGRVVPGIRFGDGRKVCVLLNLWLTLLSGVIAYAVRCASPLRRVALA